MRSRILVRRSVISDRVCWLEERRERRALVVTLSDANVTNIAMDSHTSHKTLRAPRRDNPNIELPPDDSIPVPPDHDHGPPVEAPPPDEPDYQPDPPPIREPVPD